VHVSERERLYVDDVSHDFMEVENEVRRLSFVDAVEGGESMEDAHARKQHQEQETLTSQLDSLNHSMCVLERMCSELEREIDSSSVVDGLRETLHQTTRELHNVQQRRNDIVRRLEVRDHQQQNVTNVATSSDIGTKMREIGRLVSSFSATEPIVLFVQWKTMMRGTRTFLRNEDIRVFTLDGNSHQRSATLQEHLNGGVLLLCMEDSFAGLHLPHARNIIFAHAIVADVGTVKMLEKQAIARCVREGQTSQVTVHSFMVADSAEERHWTGTH
jgi:SNF2 family DNA or RNA helicase